MTNTFSTRPCTLTQFDLFANTIEDVSRIQYKALFDAMKGLSSSITAEAASLNQTFPFVTLRNYEVFANDAKIASKSELINFSVRVSADQIQAFNAYAPLHAQEWIYASQVLANQLEGTEAEMETIQTLPFIYDTTYNIATGEQSIAPTTTNAEVLWQTSPVIKNGFLLMTNLLGIQVPDENGQFVESTSIWEAVRITQGKTIWLEHGFVRKVWM